MNDNKEFKLVGYCHSCKLYFDLTLDDVKEVEQPAYGNWVSNMSGCHPKCDDDRSKFTHLCQSYSRHKRVFSFVIHTSHNPHDHKRTTY